MNNNQSSNNPVPAGKPSRPPHSFKFQRRPRQGQTRVLRNDSTLKSPHLSGIRTNQSQISVNGISNLSAHTGQTGYRVVLGRGAHKHPGTVKHIAGARMDIIRPDAAKSMRRSPAKPMIRREGDVIPPLAADSVRIIPLGGVEEIGKNMTAIQYGDDIIVVDIGFQFKDDDTPGIDFILPNTKYLEERQDKIRAVIITHGHLDHIGGIPYVMPRIGNPPIYTRLLTSILIQKRQEEFPHVPKIDMKVVEKNETITIGKIKVKFFAVTHTIPDAMGVIIETPFGSIVHTGDLKLDHVDGVPTEQEVAEYERAFKNEKVLMLMADSTNVENPGFSLPEKVVHKNLEMIIKNMTGRLIIATFSSLLERAQNRGILGIVWQKSACGRPQFEAKH
jgi:glyoxylase-like metal-dependent hydrolase (beta-lactamase superfamily II)